MKKTNFSQFCAPKREGRSYGYIGKSLYNRKSINFKVNFGKNLSSLSVFIEFSWISVYIIKMGCFTILMREFLKFWFFSGFPGPRRRVKTQKSPKKAIFQLWSPKNGQNFQDIKNSCIRIFYTHLKCVYGNSWPNSIKIERLDRFFVFWKNCWFFVKIVIFGQKVQFFGENTHFDLILNKFYVVNHYFLLEYAIWGLRSDFWWFYSQICCFFISRALI